MRGIYWKSSGVVFQRFFEKYYSFFHTLDNGCRCDFFLRSYFEIFLRFITVVVFCLDFKRMLELSYQFHRSVED